MNGEKEICTKNREKDDAEERRHFELGKEGYVKNVLIPYLLEPEPVRDEHDDLQGDGEDRDNDDEKNHSLKAL